MNVVFDIGTVLVRRDAPPALNLRADPQALETALTERGLL